MPRATNGPKSAAPSAQRRQLLGLWAEYERLVRGGFLARAGRLYGFGIAGSFAVVAGHRAASGDADGARTVVGAALPLLSLAAGLVALAAARDLSREERESGLAVLASLAGAGPKRRAASRVFATMTLVGRAVSYPSLLLVGVAFFWPAAAGAPAVGLGRLAGAGAMAAGVLSYAVFFGVALGGLARWASALSPTHGRALFTALVCAPLLFRDVAGTPDPISAFGAVIGWIAELGSGG